MIKRFIHTILILGIATTAYTQLQPLLDQDHLNGLAINRAYAGSQGALNVGVYSRIQWVGFEGAPRTNTLAIHSPMRNKKVNLGLIIPVDLTESNMETGFQHTFLHRI